MSFPDVPPVPPVPRVRLECPQQQEGTGLIVSCTSVDVNGTRGTPPTAAGRVAFTRNEVVDVSSGRTRWSARAGELE